MLPVAIQKAGVRLFEVAQLSSIGQSDGDHDSFYRIVCVDEGTADVRLDLSSISLTEGDMLFAARGQRLRMDGADAKGWILLFAQDFFCIRLSRHEVFCDGIVYNTTHGSPTVRLPPADGERVNKLVSAMIEDAERSDAYTEELILAQLKALLLLTARQKISETRGNSREAPILSPVVIAFQHSIEKNYFTDRSVRAYAKRLGLSAQTLNRAVKRDLQRTARSLIRDRVVVEAKRHLVEGSLSVKETGAVLGFSDAAHFSRYFFESVGLYPSEFAARIGSLRGLEASR